VIVHLLDLSGFERIDPVEDYDKIRDELVRYDPRLAGLPELVVANKIDLADARDLVEVVAEELASRGVERVYPVSAVTGEGVDELRAAIARAVLSTETATVVAQDAQQALRAGPAPAVDESAYEIEVDEEGVFSVRGKAVERWVVMCDLNNHESLMHLHRQLTKSGILNALRDAGCQDGDTVRIGETWLDFTE